MARAVRWDLIADPRRYRQGFKEAEGVTKRFGGMVTKTAGLIGGAFAAVQVAGFLSDAITEAREAAKVTRQTNAVIKATGGVANVSAKDVNRLADALSVKVGVDDEVIAAGQNMLLTFKGVRTETGKGNDIFQQATKVALDMTAALNQGEVSQSALEGSTIRLGKALNDPIKGVTALTRVGVTFTSAQKKQINQLVESGKTMEAQKIILRELASEFGGAAEASADPWAKVQVAFGNLKESVGKILLPALNRVSEWLLKTLIPAAEKWWKEHGPKVREAFSKIVHIVGQLVTKFQEDLMPAFKRAAEYVDKHLTPQLDDLKKAWDDNKEAIGGLKAEEQDASKILPVVTFLAGVQAKQVERLTILVGVMARAWKVATTVVNKAVTFMVVTFVEANRTIFRVAATAAEKLHLPFAKGLRAAEREMGAFVKDFNAKANAIQDEGVNIKVKGVWVPPKGGGSMHAVVGALRARGGPVFGPGTATSDSIPAMLSTGEHVLSAREVKGMGGHAAIEAMRKRARGFAAGGAILPRMALPGAGAMTGAVGNSMDRIAAAIGRMILKVPIKGNPSIMSFIRSVDPLPYIWGGVGPGGYDCSGLVGEVMARHLGLPSYRRYFTTSSIHAGMYGLKSGLGGMLNIGVTSGSGHMAGNYMGMGFEAESTRSGIKIGGAASPPSSFARHYHLARGGRIDPRMLSGLDIGGDPGRLRINGKVFDQGGWLPPRSATLAVNRTSRPEPVGFDYDKLADAIVRAQRKHPPILYLDRQKVSRAVTDGQLWEARR